MYSMMMERECKGKYYSEDHFEEFESGKFLGFGIDYEEFDSGPAQYTTAIVELKDGKVIITTPDHIQFIHCRRGGVSRARHRQLQELLMFQMMKYTLMLQKAPRVGVRSYSRHQKINRNKRRKESQGRGLITEKSWLFIVPDGIMLRLQMKWV